MFWVFYIKAFNTKKRRLLILVLNCKTQLRERNLVLEINIKKIKVWSLQSLIHKNRLKRIKGANCSIFEKWWKVDCKD